MLGENLQKLLVEAIVKELKPAFILLFGSFAKGIDNAHSDIDLAYFSDRKLSNYERLVMAGRLSDIARRDVDLVDISQIDTVFNMQIFSVGIPLYIGDENEFIRQRMRAYSMYVTLNEQRATVIESIKKRGQVFCSE